MNYAVPAKWPSTPVTLVRAEETCIRILEQLNEEELMAMMKLKWSQA